MMSQDDRVAHARSDDKFVPLYGLVAFDPGERTGYCQVDVDSGFDPVSGDGFEVVAQGVLSIPDVFRSLATVIRPATVVAYETWRLYATHAQTMIGNDMQPSQVVGMIRYEAKQQSKKIVSNAADVKKPSVKTMPGWLVEHMAKSSEQHDQDAIMHAWFYAINRYYREAK